MSISEVALQLTISQAVFLFLASLLFQRRTHLGKLLALFSLCILGYSIYLLTGWDRASIFGGVLICVSYAIPGLVWLLAYAIFKSEEKVPSFVWWVILAYMFLRGVGTFFLPIGSEAQTTRGLANFSFYILPQIINIMVYVHTLVLVALEYQQDLMEERRKLRVAFVAVLGWFWLIVSLQVTASVINQLGMASISQLVDLLGMVRYVLLFPVICAINLLLFRIYKIDFPTETNFVRKPSSTCASHLIDPKDVELKSRLLEAMTTQRLYRQPGLSIGGLAKELGVQEYRLRSVINKGLEFSNFSHFLSSYRIAEAEKRLLSTNDSIFNIGLDVGYTSLSSFHKAFKELYGVTPKEFRVLRRERTTENGSVGHGSIGI